MRFRQLRRFGLGRVSLKMLSIIEDQIEDPMTEKQPIIDHHRAAELAEGARQVAQLVKDNNLEALVEFANRDAQAWAEKAIAKQPRARLRQQP